MRQFESVNPPSRGKRVPPSASEHAPSPPSKRQKPLQGSSSGPGPPFTGTAATTGRSWQSPRVRRTVQREGYHGLDVMNELIDSALIDAALDPRLRLSAAESQPQQASLSRNSMVTSPPTEASQEAQLCLTTHPAEMRASLTLVPSAIARLSPSPAARSSPGGQHDLYQGQDEAGVRFAELGQARSEAKDNENSNATTGELSTPPPRPHPVPSPTISDPTKVESGSENGKGGESRSGEGTSAAKFSVEFVCRVVLSRTGTKPIFERWTPQGRFQDKTLAQLRAELPFRGGDDQSRGLVFTIDSPVMTTTERILNDDEGGFLSLKGFINREIRAWAARQRRLGAAEPQPRLLLVDILIERMTDENEQNGDGLDDLEIQGL